LNGEPVPDYSLCYACWLEVKVNEYLETGEITTSLWTDAVRCHMRMKEDINVGVLRQEIIDHYRKHHRTLLAIKEAMDGVSALARQFEEQHWIGGIQGYYQSSCKRGHKATVGEMDVLLWGSAGRVLMTFQDKRNVDDPLARYNGANITLIFDETSPTARGGIQSIVATVEEATALLNDAIAHFSVDLLRANDDVTVA
jgi:hypothetical protein